MSFKAKLYKYLMSRTAPELMFFFIGSFIAGSLLTLASDVVGYISLLAVVLYGLYWLANYQKKQDRPNSRD